MPTVLLAKAIPIQWMEKIADFFGLPFWIAAVIVIALFAYVAYSRRK